MQGTDFETGASSSIHQHQPPSLNDGLMNLELPSLIDWWRESAREVTSPSIVRSRQSLGHLVQVQGPVTIVFTARMPRISIQSLRRATSRTDVSFKDSTTQSGDTGKRKTAEFSASATDTSAISMSNLKEDEDLDSILRPKRQRKEKSKTETAKPAPVSLQNANDFTNDRTVYIEGLPFDSNEDEVRGLFSSCGKIVQVRLPTWHDSSRLLGYGHILFSNAAAAKKALDLDGS